jgi:hypothetical protein
MIRLFLLDPATIFSCRVNQSAFTYPIRNFAWDGGTGTYTDTKPGMTMLLGSSAGADDLGRQRLTLSAVEASLVNFGYSSQGVMDGEVNVANDAYVTILDDYRVWAKIPIISSDGTIYKDGDIAAGTYNVNTPPVANTGPGTAATIDSGTSVITVTFDGTDSFVTTTGAVISTYLWDVDDGTITVGTSGSDTITATFPAGFRWVSLTVTDDLGVSHTARCPVYARDPAADTTISSFEIESHRITPQGQQLSVRVFEDVSTYPDGTLVMLWDDEPASATDRSHMVFVGWHDVDPAAIEASQTATLAGVALNCVDVAGRLDSLPGFPQELEGKASPATWLEMASPNMDKYLHFLIYWHSTAVEVADFTWSGTTTNYPFVILGSDGESLFDQVNRRANSLVPDYHLTCNRLGQLAVKVDPMIQAYGSRTATVQTTLTEADWSAIRYTHQRPPRIHWLRGNAIKASATTIEPMFCIAPGDAPGQGETAQESGEQLAISQSELNTAEGNRYARLNAVNGYLGITLAAGDDQGIEPADMTWVQLTVTSGTAAQRGLTWTTARGLVRELNIRYDHARGGTVKTVDLVWEEETGTGNTAPAAVTVIPPVSDTVPGDDWWTDDDYWNQPDPDLPPLHAGHQRVAAVNTDGYLYTTTDFQTTSAAGGPTWSRANLSLDGTLQSYVVDPFSPLYVGTGSTVDCFIVTTTRIYKVEDMFNAAPTVSSLHTFATALHAEGTRRIDASFGRFFATASDNPWLMVASNYIDTAGHTGVWVLSSQDAGATWSSEVQVSSHYKSAGTRVDPCGLYLSPKTPGLAYVGAFTNTADPPTADGYVSTDWGATWARMTNPDIQPGEGLGATFHVPWPDNADEDIAYHGWLDRSPNRQFRTKRVSGTTIADISPSDGSRSYGMGGMKFTLSTYDSGRRYVAGALAGNDATTSSTNDYFGVWVSSNYGDTWTNIVTPVIRATAHPEAAAFAGDTEQVLYLWGSGGYMAYGQNFGGTVDDRSGNISSLGTPGTFLGIAGGD